jgi:hypothetical protein
VEEEEWRKRVEEAMTDTLRKFLGSRESVIFVEKGCERNLRDNGLPVDRLE